MALHVTGGDPLNSACDVPQAFAWLADDPRPLDWNGPTDRPFARVHDRDLEQPIIEHFERVARQQRSRIAVKDGDTALSFGELWDGMSGLSERLNRQTNPGDLIGILLPAGPMFPLALLACLASARPFVGLDRRNPRECIEQALQDVQPALIITTDEDFPGIESRLPALRVVRLTRLPEPASPGWRSASMDVDEPACVLFTSGSTGRPKSIVNSQRNLLQRVAQSVNAAHINATDRLLTLAAPSTIVGVRDVMTALIAGASIHLLEPVAIGAREILDVIHAERISILFAFPALLRSIVPIRGERAASSLRLVRVGGDTMLWTDIDTLRAWLEPAAAIQLIYAATEAPMLQWFVNDSCKRDDVRIPIGYPLPGNRLALIDAEGDTTPPGEIGEIVVSSPYVSLGSWVDGRGDNESVEPAAGRERESRVFHTGDLGRQRSDGLLERVGRKDRQVKIHGARVDLDGVEAIVRGHRFVQDVAAIARPSVADGTMMLIAYVTARDKAPADLIDELKALTIRSAPSPMRPGRFYLIPSIPRLANSKLDVRTLGKLDEAQAAAERAEAIEAGTPEAATGDHVSQTVARVWQQVLLSPVRTANDDFFDCGGDSLKAITFVIELERELRVEIPLTLINEAPRFDQLCQALREQRAPRSTPLITLKDGGEAPPLFFIHGVGGNVVEILPAARRVTYPGAVIGIRARGVVRGEVAHTSIEAMAEDYLEAIKACQPNGPYHLCGYSSGGLVAFEIARRLSESGDIVGLVGLFDTTMSPVRWSLRTWLAIVARHAALVASALRPARILMWPIALRESMDRLRAWRGESGAAPPIAVKVAATALLASARYHPGFYRGQLTLFSPVGREPGLPSLESVWRKHALSVVTVETAGTHSTMLSARHADTTAACVMRHLPVASAI
jgi:acyl-coenzyme A synthetase/AMP-(fatty) acid ligase/thioesterase domain-containing protein/acyl carrier protein